MARIIIVGGNKDLCRALVFMFKRDGHDAECIDTVDELLTVLLKAFPDLLVLSMTSMDPSPLIPVLDRVRPDEGLRRVKTVALGEVRVSDAIGKVIAAGADGFVSWERMAPDDVVRALQCWLPEGCQ